MEFHHLDERTRSLMRDELTADVAADRLFISPRLTESGVEEWPSLLGAAMEAGDEASLSRELRLNRRMKSHEQRRTPSGGTTMAKVPTTAADTLADGEFNRFYMRALCRRSFDDGLAVEIYRAKSVSQPRSESQSLIGTHPDVDQLLEDLRVEPGTAAATNTAAIGLPNSGLSLRLVQA